MTRLYYLGHASWRITANDGRVIYVDPYGGKPFSYSVPADLILITHEHYDHNQLQLVPMKNGAKVLRSVRALTTGTYNSYDLGGIKVQALPAYNSHHLREECVGYLIEVDRIRIYHAGDTDFIPEMRNLSPLGIDYALLPCDGFYTMNTEDLDKAIEAINPKHAIPMHTHVGMDFDEEVVKQIHTPKKIVVRPGEEIVL